jgi:hypothetical protein
MMKTEQEKYLPIKGTTSDVGGMLSMKIIMKTVIPRRIVMVRDTLSPDSGGNLNVSADSNVNSTQGRIKFIR